MTEKIEDRRPLWTVAIVATLGMSASYIDRQAFSVLGPDVMKGLGLDLKQFGWLQSAFPVAYLLGAPVAGYVIDKLGARKGFAAAVVLWSIVAAAHSVAAGFLSLFALRFLLGLAEAPSFPSALQSIRRAIPGGRRGLATGLLFTGSSLGFILAAPIALGIATRFGFRFAFIGTAIVAATWIPVWLVVSRRLPNEVETTLVAKEGSAYRGGDLIEQKPARYRDVIFSPLILRGLFVVVGASVITIFANGFAAVYLTKQWNVDKGSLAFMLLCMALLFDVGSVGFGYLHTRGIGVKRLIAIAGVLAASIMFVPHAPSAIAVVAMLGCAGAGAGGLSALVTNDMMGRVPLHLTSSAGGTFAAGQSLCHMTLAPLIGSIAQDHGWSAVLVMLGVTVIPLVLAFLLWPGFREE